tara:strand:+ start:5245 stop:6606 length:1362 start_codon:yes stop_codon:yes gene_type:complete
MVLYHANGRVVKAHEDYLEREARKDSDLNRYVDQIEVVKQKAAKEANTKDNSRVQIFVDAQEFSELYTSEHTSLVGEHLFDFDQTREGAIPKEGVDRRTLMACSSLAEDLFTYQPEQTELHLPVCYPRKHAQQIRWTDFVEAYESNRSAEGIAAGKKYFRQTDDQMAYIRGDEISTYIVPWLIAMEKHVSGNKDTLSTKRHTKESKELLPSINIPNSLLEKIHLYNVMLQLGIASFFQRCLIDALVLQMYRSELMQCHLDTLEMTVCRFYSRGLPVLDPVLCHFIGTYAFRSLSDRQNPQAPMGDANVRTLSDGPHDERPPRTDEERYLPRGTKRLWLEFSNVKPNSRANYPDDTVIVPARLEVLGHCIRHWSGVRRNGSTAAAHTGYPLNVGRIRKYYRRRPTSPIRSGNNDKHVHYADYSTYRLQRDRYHQNYGPGKSMDTAEPQQSKNPT